MTAANNNGTIRAPHRSCNNGSNKGSNNGSNNGSNKGSSIIQQSDPTQHNCCKTMARVKKPQSSYLLFCHERRQQVMSEHPGARIGDIQKIISVQWKALTAEEKEVFVRMAADDKARYQQELQDKAEGHEEISGDEKDVDDRCVCMFPLGRVRKIVQSDSDVGKISKDALVAMAKAAVRTFVHYLRKERQLLTLVLLLHCCRNCLLNF